METIKIDSTHTILGLLGELLCNGGATLITYPILIIYRFFVLMFMGFLSFSGHTDKEQPDRCLLQPYLPLMMILNLCG